MTRARTTGRGMLARVDSWEGKIRVLQMNCHVNIFVKTFKEHS